ncbi:pilus assembly protein [Sinimarinibacterium sp. NLF-5-8]|uniref:pilus assembly PilX family protein n=1 Tax=Sinimarinibacterium sp. NLF-5-8 TaxID=2698684 RepID=UPI00137BA4C7|nr:pilus assembly protein [Sinimarinibacterium sp. NLF-5-8]QHS09186.1 pilus assembly protein [Sinimarinibacterium sp. NLF-5-8]
MRSDLHLPYPPLAPANGTGHGARHASARARGQTNQYSSQRSGQHSTPARAQSGVTLLIALIMLAVLAFGSVIAARNATNSDRIAYNLRAQNLALEAAELALRWCEQNVTTLPVLALNDNTITTEWQTEANWNTHGQTVPAAVLGGTIAYQSAPQCLIRRMSYDELFGDTPPSADAITPQSRGISSDYLFFFRITARGYTPNNDVGGAQAQAWVQSTVRSIL